MIYLKVGSGQNQAVLEADKHGQTGAGWADEQASERQSEGETKISSELETGIMKLTCIPAVPRG